MRQKIAGQLASATLDLARRTGNVEVLTALDRAAEMATPPSLCDRLQALANGILNEPGSDASRVWLAAHLLPYMAPELRYRRAAGEDALGLPLPPLTDDQRDDASFKVDQILFRARKVEKLDRAQARLIRRMLLSEVRPPAHDGRSIVRAAARYLGVPANDVKNLFARERAAKSYAKRHQPKTV